MSLAIGIWKEGVAKGWYEGVTIYLAVLIITIVTAGNDYMKERQFRKLNAIRKQRNCLVTRNGGNIKDIQSYDLLVGDILHLKEGDHIPADCLLIEGDELKTDESNITGESEHLKKTPYVENAQVPGEPFLLADSMVVNGKGIALVCCVG